MYHEIIRKAPLPRISLISGGMDDEREILLQQLKRLPRSVPCMVQIREKHLHSKQLLLLARKAVELNLSGNTLLLINERVDIALSAGLHGVHLPENACPPDKLRAFAPEMLFGCSVHSPASALSASAAGADYLLFGPVFDTPSKRRYGPPQGPDKLGELCRTTSLPVFAIGGITPENANLCLAEGAYGIAALSIFRDNPETAETLDNFYRLLYP